MKLDRSEQKTNNISDKRSKEIRDFLYGLAREIIRSNLDNYENKLKNK